MNIIWSPEANADLSAIEAFIAADDPAAARRVLSRILDAVEIVIADNPRLGRAGRVPGTRELFIPKTPFIIPYRVKAGKIHILRVYHGARRWPEML